MMKSIAAEKLVSFKELEQKVFEYICRVGWELLRLMLEQYDDELAEGRDKARFRNKGFCCSCIKILCGEVEYRHGVYETMTQERGKTFIYLLEEARHVGRGDTHREDRPYFQEPCKAHCNACNGNVY